MKSDKEIIEMHGGVSALARLLRVSAQRVSNWNRRGIPPAIKLSRPDLFLSTIKQSAHPAETAAGNPRA